MKVVHAVHVALTGSPLSEPATVTWPEVVAQLAGERGTAETCVALLKKYGDEAQIAHGQLTYTKAKADFGHGNCGTDHGPFRRADARKPVESANQIGQRVSGLREFCGTVDELIPKTTGQKGLADIVNLIPLGRMRYSPP